MVAVPALVSGGMAIAAGIGGATLTGIVGGCYYNCWSGNRFICISRNSTS